MALKRAAPLGVSEQGALCCYRSSNTTAALHLPSSSDALTFTLRHLPLRVLALVKHTLFIGAHEMQTCKETNGPFAIPF